MRRSPSAVTGRHGVRICEQIFEEQFGWIFRDLGERDDYGIDAWVEVVGTPFDDQLVTGRFMALQIKDGDSYFEGKETDDGWRFNSNPGHLSYWLGYSMPVLVVIVSPDGQAFWHHITNSTVQEFERGFRIDVSKSNRLSSDAKAALTQLAVGSYGLVESLPSQYEHLPPDAVGMLREAEKSDRVATARLAERLVRGRYQPGLTVSGLLALRPSWLAASPAAQRLWMAVGGYAANHELPGRVAADAFVLAADAPGDASARAHAFAGASLLFTEYAQDGRTHLEAARAGGQTLLADFGLAVLDVPSNTAPAINVPASIAAASREALDKEPTVLNFLAENAKRHGQPDEGIELRRRAIRDSRPGSGIALELAKELVSRAGREGRSTGKDVREALRLAQAAAIDRRRWAGPSAAAVAVAVQVLFQSNEYRQAIAESTSVLDGGRALADEASDRTVIRNGAFAALASGNDQALERYLSLLPDESDMLRRQLLAHQTDRDAADEDKALTVPLWRELAQASDDELATVAVAHLAHRGIWSERADELVARSILPREQEQLLRAVCLTHTDRDRGLQQLRELATRSPHAAAELVLILDDDNLDEALAESARQLERWHSWDLAEQRMALLLSDGDVEAAHALAQRCITDAAYSDGARQRAARWLSQQRANVKEFAAAAQAAEAGLGLSDDEDDLAWLYVAALYDAGDLPGARAGLRRFTLTPVTDTETDLWLHLHTSDNATVADAETLLTIIERLPEGRYRTAVRALLLREVLTQQPNATPYPQHIIHDARALAAEAGVDPDNLDPILVDAPLERLDPTEYQAMVAKARKGHIPLADLADWCDRSYTSALLDSPFGAVIAGDAGQALRQHGCRTAQEALAAPEWIIDLSAVAVLTRLDANATAQLRSLVPALKISAQAVRDLARAREELRGTAVAYQPTSAFDSVNTRTRRDPQRVAALREHGEAMETMCAQLTVITGDQSYTNALAAAVELAAIRTAPLWCDDSAARQRARGAGIATFSTIDLIEAMELPDTPELVRQLAASSVIDLPLSGDDVITLAAQTRWHPGPAHTALASPGCWRNWSDTWHEPWANICSAAVTEGIDALVIITQAGLTGALAFVEHSRITSRYLQTVVLALTACHASGTAPADYLERVASKANPDFVPTSQSIRAALTSELTKLEVPQAPLVAAELLKLPFTP